MSKHNSALTSHDAARHADNWRGYTLEELRYRRAYVDARRELERERIAYNLSNWRQHTASAAGTTLKRIGTAIPAVNYAVAAVGVGMKVMRLFRRKKKKH